MFDYIDVTCHPDAKSMTVSLKKGGAEAYGISARFKDGVTQTYAMEATPADDSLLVAVAQKEILQDITLDDLLANLRHAVDLMFLAYCGVSGRGESHAKVNEQQNKLLELCYKCASTMRVFKDSSDEVIERVKIAYGELLEGHEEDAISDLAKCATQAKEMADKANALAGEFKDLRTSTELGAHDVALKLGDTNKARDDLRLEREKMAAMLGQQKQNNADFVTSIAKLQGMYDDAKDREAEQSKYKLYSSLVSAFGSAMGAGLSAYSAIKNPLGTAVNNMTQRQPEQDQSHGQDQAGAGDSGQGQDGAGTGDSAPQHPDNAAVTAAKQALQQKQSALDEAQAAEAAAKEKLEGARKAKDAAVNTPEAGDKAVAFNDASDDLESAHGKTAAAEAEKEKAEKALKQAESGAGSNGSAAGAAAAAKAAAEAAKKMAEDSKSAEESIHEEKMLLLNKMLDMEAQQRATLGQIALLTKQLEGNAEEQDFTMLTIHALELAIWAFENIVTTLLKAQQFWENMRIYCEKLATSDIGERMEKEKRQAPDPEVRRAFYLSAAFMPLAIMHLVRWTALKVLAAQYEVKANEAKYQCTKNINAAPGQAEAVKNVPKLADEFGVTLSQNIDESHKRSKELEATMAQSATVAVH